MTVRDLLAAVVRTGVPYAVGAVLTWLATRYGIVLGAHESSQVVASCTALAGTAYYVAVRLLERRWRWLGWLLGWNVPPLYPPKIFYRSE